MISILASAITSLIICFMIMPVIIKYSLKKNIVDIPGDRKVHNKLTPSMGGISIYIAFIIASLIWTEISLWSQLRIVLVALTLVFFIGVRDDLVPLQPITKIIGQILAAIIVIVVYDIRLKSFYGLAGIYDIPQWFGIIISIFTIVVITNAFNLIDGLDGLAGTVGSLALLFFGSWFYLVGDIVFAILSFSLFGALIGFLIFNWEPSRVFMGDTGTMITGMMLSISSIHFIDSNFNLPNDHPFRLNTSVSAAVAVLIIPLVDTLRVFIVRIVRRQSPFKADKNHIHHALIRLGLSHSKTSLLLGGTQFAFIGLVILLKDFNDNYLLAGIIVLAVILSLFLDHWVQKQSEKQSAV